MLKKGDIIEFTVNGGYFAGMLIRATVVEIMTVYDPLTFKPVERIIVSFYYNGKRQELALPEDCKYEIVTDE